MSSPLRVKIEYGDSSEEDAVSLKFIYLITSPASITIEKLISSLQDFISTQFSRQDIHLVNLSTEDGYLLMKNHLCSDILINNEKLMCIDMNQFIQANINALNTEEAWFKLVSHDSTDGIEKRLIAGINNTGKFYVFLYGDMKNRVLYLFNVIELLAIAHGTHKGIDQLKWKISETTPFDWFVEAKWEHDSTSTNTLFLIGNLKTGDNAHISSGKLRLTLNDSTKTIDSWEVIDQSNTTEANNHMAEEEQIRWHQLKESIPPPEKTGPTINNSIESVQINTHECEGDSALRLSQENESTVDMAQDTHARDGTCYNFVSITHILISKKPVILPEILNQKRTQPVDKAISIVRVNVQYQRQDGKWIDCQNAKIVQESDQKNDKQRVATSILNIEPDKVILVSFDAAIQVKGNPNRNHIARRRAHRSLPQPLKLKVIVTDNLSKTCSLVVEQLNQPLELITPDKFLERKKDAIKRLIAFVYADDCDCDERIFMAVSITTDNSLMIHNNNSSVTLERTQMRTMKWNAMKNKKTEEPVNFLSNSQTKVSTLFDSETYLLYAIRIELNTATSHAVETVLIPLDEIN